MTAKHLMPLYISVPRNEGLQEIVDGFKNHLGFLQAFGTIDSTHIPILRPQESPSDYFNRNGCHSILMQAVVDFRSRFLDVNVGWPGEVHDTRVLVNSSLYRKAINGTLVPDWSKRIDRTSVPL